MLRVIGRPQLVPWRQRDGTSPEHWTDISGIIEHMLSAVVEDAEINIIRDLLDNLAQRRSDTGLAPTEEDHYKELCAMEPVATRLRTPVRASLTGRRGGAN
jgi:hypothetical protein